MPIWTVNTFRDIVKKGSQYIFVLIINAYYYAWNLVINDNLRLSIVRIEHLEGLYLEHIYSKM